MHNFKTYLFNGPFMQNLENSFPCQQTVVAFNLFPATHVIRPFPGTSRDYSQPPCPSPHHNTPISGQPQNPVHCDLPWGYSRKTKFKMCLKLFIDLVSKSFTAHYESLYFKTWIKLFYARPKTSFPPQRAFSFPGTQSGSCKQPLPENPVLGTFQLREHWGFTAECSVQGQQPPSPACHCHTPGRGNQQVLGK